MFSESIFKRLQSILIAFAALVFISFTYSSAYSQADLGNYFAIQYYKVKPTQENTFINLQRDVWKKIHKARIQNDLLDGWFLSRVVAPSGTNSEYNYLIVFEYDSAEKLTAHFEGYGVNYSTILDTEEIALALRSPEIADMVYEEVWRTADQAFVQNSNNQYQYKYQVFNSMKLKPGVDEAEYLKLEHDIWKPIHEERIRRNMMYGWAMYTMIIPGGTERNYHWATVDFYHNLKDYLTPTIDILRIIHGPEKAPIALEKAVSIRDLLKREVRELLDYMNEESLN